MKRPLLAIAVVVAILATACTIPFGGGSHYEVTAEFDRAVNLFPGNPVRVVGVDVGRIKRIEVPEGSDVVRVKVAINRDAKLPADVRAVIVPQALIGERYLQFDPPYTGGEELENGATIPASRTGVPTEFDEVLDQVNDYLRELSPEEVARAVTNIAAVLDGNGEKLGRTLENAEEAIDVLRDNDDELIALVSTLSDLNETLASRDEELGELIEDWNLLAATLAANRQDIDAALNGLARMTRELALLLRDHRPDLESDIATLTRVGRTAVRNLGEIDRFLHWSAELYRHADRILDIEHNWLPQLNQSADYNRLLADRVEDRLVGLCIRLGVEVCQAPAFWEGRLADEICAPPLLLCPEDRPEVVPLPEALGDALDRAPELREQLEEEAQRPPDETAGEAVDDALDATTRGDGEADAEDDGEPLEVPTRGVVPW